MLERVYFDYNATAPALPEVVQSVSKALSISANSSSIHSYGRRARSQIDDARESIAELVGAAPSEIVFTSGGTESNNLAIRGVDAKMVLASAVEHVSILSGGDNVIQVSVDSNGIVEIDALRDFLAQAPKSTLVTVMYVNNETGVIQPIREISDIVHEYGALIHCDAVQAVGKIPCKVAELGVDFMSISGHKLGAPQGIGALVVREGLNLNAIIRGGGQETSVRSGTENFSGIIGFGVAAKSVNGALIEYNDLYKLREYLENKLKMILPVRVFGQDVARIPNTSCFTMPGVSAEIQVMRLDLKGIAVSSGAACSSGKVETSHVLRAMGVGEIEASTAIRVSMGRESNKNEIDYFVDVWAEIWRSSMKTDNFKMAMVV